MSCKRSKRTNSRKKSNKQQSEQLCMTVVDHGATISSSDAQNHFGFAPFHLTITVEPQPISDLEPQPLTVQLVFEDGLQIDTTNSSNKKGINFTTAPSALYINSSGQCKFTVQIDTYSMYHDNRAFKLVFNLSDSATRHIRPCETKPFRLVKHRLEIVKEPDPTFFKDEGGRANCLRCKILLKDCNSNIVKNRDIPLTAKLVYEDMSLAQSSRDILEIITQNVELKKGQCGVDFRINEVSKNHNKRQFRVLYECKSQDALYHDISSCVTNRIMVKSKRTKKKPTTARSRGSNKRTAPSSITSSSKKRAVKRKHESPSYSDSSEGSVDLDDMDLINNHSDDGMVNVINEPSIKKRRRSLLPPQTTINHNPYSHEYDAHLHSTLPQSVLNSMSANNDNTDNNTIYVPPALTGILPSIRPGALPRIGHQPPPFASLSKKNNPLKHEAATNAVDGTDGNGGGGGVLGNMFNWCKLAGWVMNRLEWTQCGYEYDEATHSIDTTRPLYRCSYCLKFRNISGWGNHENWCQLKLALKEYESKVKSLYSEWNYQLNNNKDPNGGMNTLDHDDSPRLITTGWGNHENWCQLKLALKEYESKVKSLYSEWNYQLNNNKDPNGGMNTLDHDDSPRSHNNHNSHNKDKNKENTQLPSINNTNPVLSAGGFSVAGTVNTAPFIVTPNASAWPPHSAQFAPHHQAPHHAMNHSHHPLPFQSPSMMTFNAPPPMNAHAAMVANSNNNGNVNTNNGAVNNHENVNNSNKMSNKVKNEAIEREQRQNQNSSMNLPAVLHKVDSVSRVRSQHGYDAYDTEGRFLGAFDDNGTFFDADQLQFDGEDPPIFDSANMLSRNQSDDHLFFNTIRRSIFDHNSTL
eukprot:CAMPEP_0197073024 /NCGR_PEP_ID=MMETSP1384-20130603/210395_1 /TAXON_ID=29189 /ORGANISM="Ammonia sp." /LENGTH=861 /DNA_ID=CAMNT_0042511849 /DNA_START=108 /DNA_END=2697 /DNA_ORIENTATION=-